MRSFAIHDIASALGPEKSSSLPLFHALTGCDSLLFLRERQKDAMATWMTYDEVTAAFLELSRRPTSLSDECLKKIERFIVLLYDRTGSKLVVNEARKQFFAQKGRTMDAIPSTQAALVRHIKRAAYQEGYC